MVVSHIVIHLLSISCMSVGCPDHMASRHKKRFGVCSDLDVDRRIYARQWGKEMQGPFACRPGYAVMEFLRHAELTKQ